MSAADRLVEGKGLTPIGYHYAPAIPSGRPLVSFPPAYPLLLSSASLFTNDRLAGAKYIHSFLFAANVFLLGLIIYISSQSIWPALCAMGLFQTSYPLLSIYTMALAEPLFMFFLLSNLLGVVFYTRKAQLWLLLACGSTAAAALMTRYAAVTILVPLVLTVFIQNGPSRGSFKRAVLVGRVALLPLVVWVIRNRLVAGSSTGRSLAFHFIGTVACTRRIVLKNNHTLVIYFDKITWRSYLPDRNELEESHKLPVVTRLADGVVYGAQSGTLQHLLK